MYVEVSSLVSCLILGESTSFLLSLSDRESCAELGGRDELAHEIALQHESDLCVGTGED